MSEFQPLYYKYYLKADPDQRSLTSLLEELEDLPNVKKSLYEDILLPNEVNLNYIFNSTRHDDVQTISRNELTSLNSKLLLKDQQIFQSIFHSAINGGYADRSEKVINNLYVVYANKQTILNYSYIEKLISSKLLSIKNQIRFTRVLSGSRDGLKIEWSKFDFAKLPQIVPAYINFHKEDAPLKAVASLKYLKDDFVATYGDFLRNGIEDSLLNIVYGDMYEEYMSVYKTIHHNIIRSMIQDIVKRNENLSNYILTEEDLENNLNIAQQLAEMTKGINAKLTKFANLWSQK